jgi:outer membrane lipoprotein-sorting protein
MATLVLLTASVRADSISNERLTRAHAGTSLDGAGLTASTAPDELDQVRASAARLHDVTGLAEMRDVNRAEFIRFKKNAQSLQFKRFHFYYQGPDKIRVDAQDSARHRISRVQNGDRETWRTSLGLRRTRDLSRKPARKADTLKIGILTSMLWESYRIQRLNDASIEGSPCLTLKMTLIRDPGNGHYIVWLDRTTFRVVGWERFTTTGELRVRHMFREPEQSPDGVWYSRRIELYTPQGTFVAAIQLTDIHINQGLDAALFR